MADWRFREPRPGDKIRNPVQGEFFSDEAIEKPGEALVREAIQNSLDARVNGKVVRVRIYLSGQNRALEPDRAARWLAEAWKHAGARDSGLRDVPGPEEPCSFIVIEDFGTSGLTGDVRQFRPGSGSSNRFFAFWRAEGVSEKNTGERGRWGVGKTVFPRSSRINTFFGLTVRADDGRRLLLGQTVLRHHELDGKWYAPDGDFGVVDNDEDFVLPIEDDAIVDLFRDDFGVTRRREPGLSIVIPYPDSEISGKGILDAVIRQYFWPLIEGTLEVELAGNGVPAGRVILAPDSLEEALEPIAGEEECEMLSVIRLAQRAREVTDDERVILRAPDPQGAPGWFDDMIPEEDLPRLRTAFLQGDLLALRVPIWVREMGNDAVKSYFDVYLQRDRDRQGAVPVFVRNGIIIPDVRQRRRGRERFVSLVVIEDRPIASLLADAETPAHTRWDKNTANFKGKYVYGDRYIQFVASAPRQLVHALTRVGEEQDILLLADIFPRPAELQGGLEAEEDEPAPEPGDKPEKPEPPGKRSADPFAIQKLAGGFRVSCNKGGDAAGKEIEVLAAYDRSFGEPFRRYDPADFRLEHLNVSVSGGRLLHRQDNRLRASVDDPDQFEIRVLGFDERRDVVVKARTVE